MIFLHMLSPVVPPHPIIARLVFNQSRPGRVRVVEVDYSRHSATGTEKVVVR